MNAWFVLVTILLLWIQPNGAYESEEAYVTLLYGDEFLLGVRVLGKSIRDTGSKKDMVVLVSDGVSDYANKLLEVNCFIVSPFYFCWDSRAVERNSVILNI